MVRWFMVVVSIAMWRCAVLGILDREGRQSRCAVVEGGGRVDARARRWTVVGY